ncbi:unnamed protein product, partial [Amoebophrya sp. A25]
AAGRAKPKPLSRRDERTSANASSSSRQTSSEQETADYIRESRERSRSTRSTRAATT